MSWITVNFNPNKYKYLRLLAVSAQNTTGDTIFVRLLLLRHYHFII